MLRQQRFLADQIWFDFLRLIFRARKSDSTRPPPQVTPMYAIASRKNIHGRGSAFSRHTGRCSLQTGRINNRTLGSVRLQHLVLLRYARWLETRIAHRWKFHSRRSCWSISLVYKDHAGEKANFRFRENARTITARNKATRCYLATNNHDNCQRM